MEMEIEQSETNLLFGMSEIDYNYSKSIHLNFWYIDFLMWIVRKVIMVVDRMNEKKESEVH